MERDNLDFTNVNQEELPRLIAEMNENLAQHTIYLEKHFASMDALSESIKQLDITIKRLMKNDEVSLQLRQELTSFVEQHINPLYYKIEMYSTLPSPPHVKHHRLPKGKPPNLNI
jgi:hypothetical protein